jgi:tRNA 2-selenouridine synthase
MKEGYLVLITASLETRVKRIVEDYPVEDEETAAQVLKILGSLKRNLGGPVTDTLCGLLRQGRLAELVRILLVEYYDRRYENNLSRYSYRLEVSSEDIGEAAAALREFRGTVK